MENELDLYSLFENMTWPANKEDLLKYSADNEFLEDFYEIINNVNVQDDYFFSSINDLCSFIYVGGIEEENESVQYEEFSI